MKYANGVKATTLTTGTGDVTLAAVSGYVPFPLAFSVGDTIPYAIRNDQNWEWGVGTVQAGGVLERTTVASTLVAGVFTDVAPARITLTGVSEVVCAITAEDYKALNDSLFAHTTDVANPHGVTAAQANADEAGTAAGLVSAHEATLDPHDAYALEADLGTAAFLDAGTAVGDLVQVQAGGALPALDASALLNLPASGVTDHGALTGLADDDHTQYHTDARGDARYAPIAKGVTGGDTHNHDGGDGAQIAYASLSGLPTLGSAAAAATGDFEAAGAVSTHNAVATAHGISAWGATLVDDADASAARSTLGLGTAATTASTAYATSTQGANADSHAGNTSNPHSVSKTQVGLGSVDNTSDASKPVSTAQQTALNLKANLASPTFTGTVSGITAAMVGAPAGSGTSTGTNTGDETTTTIGALLNGATSKTTPVDADHIGLMDSAASNIWKKLSWANLKTALSSTFVTLAGVSQTLSGKIGLGVTPTEKLSVAGNVNISGSYLYGNSAVGPVEVYGFFTDLTGYGQGGLPALVPGSFDRLMFLDKKGGTITSSITPATGAETLVNIVDGTAAFAKFDATGSPVVITMTLESAYSNQRDFSIIFYQGYAPSSFTVQFYDASNALLGEDVQTAWPSTQSVYVFKTGISFYGTKKVIITLNAPKSGYSYYHIFSVFWSNYNYQQSPSSVNRKFGGDVYVGLNVAVNSGSLGVGTSAPSAKIHAIATTEQLRCGYDASNYLGSTTNSAGVTTFNLVGTAPAAKWTVSDATTNAIYDVATFSKNSSGAGAAGLGLQIVLAAKSSTTVDMPQAGIASEWVNATHATRTSRLKLSTNDYGGAREGIRVESDGAVPRLGFYGATAVVKPTALTASVSAAPAGGTGTADGGWDTSTNRDLAIATINNLKTRVDQLETKLQALGLLT
jgi:hypothetical protein